MTPCPHCPYTTHRFEAGLATAYRDAILRETNNDLRSPQALSLETLYIGGGTPTQTLPTAFYTAHRMRSCLISDAQFAIETYPTDSTPDVLHRLRKAGGNRVSLGVDSLDFSLLRRLARRCGPDDALASIRAARADGFDLIDVSLLLGISGQSVEGFLDGLSACLSAAADQISAYPLFTFDHTRAGAPGRETHFARVDDAARLRMQRQGAELCFAHGFERTSVWRYTRKGLGA